MEGNGLGVPIQLNAVGWIQCDQTAWSRPGFLRAGGYVAFSYACFPFPPNRQGVIQLWSNYLKLYSSYLPFVVTLFLIIAFTR